jgi:S-formylglutathione hydrolase
MHSNICMKVNLLDLLLTFNNYKMTTSNIEQTLVKEHESFGGKTAFWSHESSITKTQMKFSTFMPKSKKIDQCIIWLSGLTCNDENFISKSGVQRYLQGSGTMIICPDTSPRGLNLPGEHDSYDFGSAAGFYVNATVEGYKDHYRMFDYISNELHEIILKNFSIPASNISIMGHSMGGHGALILGLNFPEKYKSISAFSPIVNPINCPWGKKAFRGYLGNNQESWKKYDACELVKANKKHPKKILIDQGSNDDFLKENLLTQNFIDICEDNNQPSQINFRENYDHSYYFISTFIEDHIEFHLNNN